MTADEGMHTEYERPHFREEVNLFSKSTVRPVDLNSISWLEESFTNVSVVFFPLTETSGCSSNKTKAEYGLFKYPHTDGVTVVVE